MVLHNDQTQLDDESAASGMVGITLLDNAHFFEAEFDWLYNVIDLRLQNYFKAEKESFAYPDPPATRGNNHLHHLLAAHHTSVAQRIIILLALTPHLKPQLLDVFFTTNKELQRGFAEFGGMQGKAHSGFLPTIETALFLLAGTDIKKRCEILSLFDPHQYLFKENILILHEIDGDEPMTAMRIDVSHDFLNQCLFSRVKAPKFGAGFPARKLESRMTWDDLVLDPFTLEQLEELLAWLQHGPALLRDWQLEKKLMPGYRCLFHGPPGTGKTITAALLGETVGKEVYRVDLSMIVSKYIGETEKNLEKVFTHAETKDWILFFDEADALFGSRTSVNDSHDRFANQQTSYLLQRVESYPGVVILATNLKWNIDEAFSRRFQSVIHFPMPTKELREQLWQKSFSPCSTLAENIDMGMISEKYEITGGAIMNVVRFCSLMAMKNDCTEISKGDLVKGILRELNNEGRSS